MHNQITVHNELNIYFMNYLEKPWFTASNEIMINEQKGQFFTFLGEKR